MRPCFKYLCLLTVILTCGLSVTAQSLALIPVGEDAQTLQFAERLNEELGQKLKILDISLVASAYASARPADPFNMTDIEGKRLGAVIGSQAFLIVRSAVQRRSAFGRTDYYEAYAVLCLVSSRSGRLLHWKLQTVESSNAKKAAELLTASIPSLADEIREQFKTGISREISEPSPPGFEEAPEQAVADLKLPVPYRRSKPEYTAAAALYSVEATVDTLVYLDPAGRIVRTETVRWAGFGLNESAKKNIRSMNWRPAERNGKPVAMKFLVRYNFKKADRTENERP